MKIIISIDEILYTSKYFTLLRSLDDKGSHEYFHRNTFNGNAVAVLGVTQYNNQYFYLSRYESVKAHRLGIQAYALTGGCETDNPVNDAIHELYEESGIKKFESIVSLGTVRESKHADTIIHLYAVKLNNELLKYKKLQGPGDGSKGEMHGYCKWLTVQEVLNLSQDPILLTMIFKYNDLYPLH